MDGQANEVEISLTNETFGVMVEFRRRRSLSFRNAKVVSLIIGNWLGRMRPTRNESTFIHQTGKSNGESGLLTRH